MHEIKADVPVPVIPPKYGSKYWFAVFDKMQVGDHIIIDDADYSALRINSMRWRKKSVANLPYRFVARRHGDKTDRKMMIWKTAR